MIVYEPLIGESIRRAVEKLCSLADAGGETARATFNGVELVAAPGVNPADVEQRWRDECSERSRAYSASPEGRAAAQRRAEQIVENQAAVDALVAEMRTTLNAEDVPSILRWLQALARPGDDVDVRVPSAEILGWFASHGYEIGVNCGADFDANDRENVARWIIGQALEGIQTVGAPHSVLHKFADAWLSDSSIGEPE